MKVAGSDFPPCEFIGGEILSYFGYILLIVQQGEPWKSLPPSQADGRRARSLRGERGPLGDALVVSAQDEELS